MTRDEIIRIGVESGLLEPGYPVGERVAGELERFAAMVAAAERERCAITAWGMGMDAHNAARGLPCDAREIGSKAASAIRARGQA